MELAQGGVRLEARYTAFGRAASMVFHFRHPAYAAATHADCKAIAEAYGLWENDGLGFGYSLLRSTDSAFTVANAFGISPTLRASFIDARFYRSGQVPSFLSPMVPSTLAPLIRWGTLEKGPRTGRTYLVGISEGVTGFGTDQEFLGPGAGATIQAIMDQLRVKVASSTGYVQCHYSAGIDRYHGPNPHLLDITGSGVYNLLASQRRRTRPGR